MQRRRLYLAKQDIMIKIEDKNNCCGCEACVQVCPKQCISFDEDSEGFRYPLVNDAICINCGLCEIVCPVLNTEEAREPLLSYAAINNNESERMKSSSGGIFILLARHTISKGGVVFGAKFDEEWNVVHSYSENEAGLSAFMGSKYVQSRIGNTYKQAKEFLNEGRVVLFSGTPCQIAGLRNFLRKDYDNLLTIDVICHGVPSPMVWQEYLREIKECARKGENSVSTTLNPSISGGDSRRNDLSISGISFRDKRLGWKKFSFALTLAEAIADGKKNTVLFSHIHDKDPYFLGFNNYNLYLRPSCYQCPVRDLRSGSDITLADFWGIGSLLPHLDDDKGVSVIMVNTEKGQRITKQLGLRLFEVKYNDIESRNTSVHISSVLPRRDIFDVLRYRKCLQNKREYYYYDNVHTVSEKVAILGHPSMYARIRHLLGRIYRKLFK